MRLKYLVAICISTFAFTQLVAYAGNTPKKNTNTQPADVAPVAPAPSVDIFHSIYDQMSQNVGRITQGSTDWFKRIRIGGGLNFDAHWGNRSMGYNGENDQQLSLNDAYLNANAAVNDWVKAFLSINYNNASPSNGIREGMYDSASRPYRVNLNQGYITLANFKVWPVFIQVGKQYTDYGRYTIFPITRSLTQVMTESLQTSAKLGFIAPVFGNIGFNGQIYAFDPSLTEVGLSHKKTVYGAALGLSKPSDQFGFDLGVGYMSNIIGVNDIAYSVSTFQGVSMYSGNYTHLVGGIAVYGDLNTGPFSFNLRYTTALQQFAPTDLSNFLGSTGANGSKPWAADFTAGLNFLAFEKKQTIYLGYQASGNAVAVLIPMNRILLGYSIDIWKNTMLGFEVDHDKDYSSGHGGTGKSTNLVGVRVGVKFG